MSDNKRLTAPDRIYIDKVHGRHPEDWNWSTGEHLTKKRRAEKIEYVRADIIKALVRETDKYKWQVRDTCLRAETAERENNEICALVPNHFLLDPPDGGNVTLLEGVQRLVSAWQTAERERDEARQNYVDANEARIDAEDRAERLVTLLDGEGAARKAAVRERDEARAALEKIANGPREVEKTYAELFAEVCAEARAALPNKGGRDDSPA